MLNVQLFSLGNGRSEVKSVLSMLDILIRDAAVLGKNPNADVMGCYRKGAEELSRVLVFSQTMKIHRIIEKAERSIDSNVTIPLVTAAMSGEIIAAI